MNNPPSGTVTLLFTDIEGSTTRWEHQTAAMQSALARHDAIMRRAIDAQDGYVFKTVGDAFYAAFTNPSSALWAASTAQYALQDTSWDDAIGPIRVRMALHTGMPESRDNDYFGPPLNRVARLISAGYGGQVLLTEATAALVRDALPPNCRLLDLGEHHLKDLIRPEHVYQLHGDGLPAAFPPLKTATRKQHNLPSEQTDFIGRLYEAEMIQTLVRRADTRLVTLLGPGGTGKTRMSQHVAGQLLADFPDGVWFVDLSPITDPSLVVNRIAEAMDIRESGDTPLLDRLKAALADKQTLLVLDNFEQVADAAGTMTALLNAAPRVKALVTSRVPLRIYGEKEYHVPPLALPDLRRLPPLEQLTQYEAVRLFIERAQDVRADFAITNENAPAVAQICARLDGLPLAIELAATRIRMFSPQALLARLEQRLKLLTGGARNLPGRQQTLRGAIEWSHDLLDEGEQQLFRRVAVFSGGRTLEAIEAVCNAEGDLELDVLDGIESLLSKSLLRQEDGPDSEPRFVMLETIHEYARERLEQSGEAQATQERHSAYFLALAEQAEPELEGPHQAIWLHRLEAEHDNLRTALRRALGKSEVETALRLGGALASFWVRRGYLSEGRAWLTAVLARVIEASVVPDGTAALARTAHAKLLQGAGLIALLQKDNDAARVFLEESLAISRGLKDIPGSTMTLVHLGGVVYNQGDHDAARALLQESLAVSRELGDKRGIAWSLVNLGFGASIEGDYDAARALYEENLTISRELGNTFGMTFSLIGLGYVNTGQGNYDVARALYEENLTIMRELGDKHGIADSLARLGHIASVQGNLGAARALCEESLTMLRDLGEKSDTAFLLSALGRLVEKQGDVGEARALLQEGLAVSREFGDKLSIAFSLNSLGYMLSNQEDYDEARALFQESLAISREIDYKVAITWSLSRLGFIALYTRDDAAARTRFDECLALLHRMEDKDSIALCLEGMACLATDTQPVRAARLWGMAQALWTLTGAALPEIEQAHIAQRQAIARAHIDEAAWIAAWEEGRTMSLEQAVTYALSDET